MGIFMQSCSEVPSQYILMTYRSSIKPYLPSTTYTSDAGWGCMIRVTQMFIANYLHLYLNQPLDHVLHKFLDNKQTEYSIQLLTKYGNDQFGKKNQEWYTPAQGAFLVKQFIQKNEINVRVNICSDNCLFWSTIQLDRPQIIVFLMARIGLNEPQPEYLKVILKLVSSKFFEGILGGRPKYAHLFIGISGNGKSLRYLDPHRTYSSIQDSGDLLKRKQQFYGKVKEIQASSIDTSMCVGFRFKRQEFQEFKKSIQEIRSQMKEEFFLYIAEEVPQYDQNDIIEIVGDD